ncbi:MAG: alpha/beta hydrolase [Alphaproteobacteria bacterium]
MLCDMWKLGIALLLTACAAKGMAPDVTPLTQAAGLQRVEVTAEPFVLTAFVRNTNPNASVHVYVEGDGYAYVTKTTPSGNPTPHRPVALELALQDLHPNMIYLARPCQYTPVANNPACADRKWWTTHRFDAVSLAALNEAVDKLKQNASQHIELIGFSGGATMALLLAAQRHDVISVRTVAGNLSPAVVNHVHGVSSMPNALDPRNVASKLQRIPQHHWVGANDKVITPAVAETYHAALPIPHCSAWQVVPAASHTEGWHNWAEGLSQPLPCKD